MRFLRLGLVLGLSLCSLSLAADREARDDDEINAIRGCLAAWGEHPFNSADEQPFRAISPSVKVLGVGQDVTDETVTDQPQLVLVKPSVNVLTKSNFRLMNPNGWYCFAANVTVLAKSEMKRLPDPQPRPGAEVRGDVARLPARRRGGGFAPRYFFFAAGFAPFVAAAFTSISVALIRYCTVTFSPTLGSPVTLVLASRPISQLSLPFFTVIVSPVIDTTGPVTW